MVEEVLVFHLVMQEAVEVVQVVLDLVQEFQLQREPVIL